MRILLTHTPAAFEGYFGDRALAALERVGTVVRNEGGSVLDTADALLAAAEGCEVVVADRATPGPAAFFERARDIRAFCRVAVDVSTIDLEAARRHGVTVTRATPGFGPSVAELGLGLMIDLARGITDAAASYRSGVAPAPRMGRQLAGASVGIIGHGVIGRHLAGLCRAAGMTVLISDPAFAEAVPLPALLEAADFVVCLAPAVAATRGLMDGAAFARMRRGAFFVNLSRSSLVDEAALAAALESGQLGGAALDVGSAPDQMPPAALARRPDVIATPHIGGLTRQATEHQAFDAVRQVEAIAAGRVPDGVVTA